MFRTSPFPLRALLPLLLGIFATIILALSYITTRPAVNNTVEHEAKVRLRTSLAQFQSTLELLIRKGQKTGIQNLISAMGAERGSTVSLLVSSDGDIKASTQLTDIGKTLAARYPDLDQRRVNHVLQGGGSDVKVDQSEQTLSGYVRVCETANTSLRSSECGYLYTKRSLAFDIKVASKLLQSQMLKSMLAIAVTTLLLLAFLTSLVTKRVQTLLTGVRHFANGQLTARTQLTGGDEFAAISSALDTTFDKIVADQGELRLRDNAIYSSTNGIVIADALTPDNPVVYVNNAFVQMSGFSQDEVLGKNCRFMQGEDREQPQIKTLRDAIKSGSPCNVTLRNYRKDGTMFWNELSVSPVVNDAGQVTHFIGNQTDITERVTAQEQLQQNYKLLEERVESRTVEFKRSERRYRELFENAREFILILDTQGTVKFINPVALATLEYSASDASALSIYDLVRTQDHANCRLMLRRIVKGQSFEDLEATLISRSQNLVQVEGSAIRSVDENHAISIKVILHDVTRRLAAEEALRRAKEVAESATQTKSRLLAAANHDLRQPLQSIQLYLGVLSKNTSLNDAAESVCTKISESVESMNSLISTLLDVSRLESGVITPDKTVFNSSDVVASIVNGNESQAHAKGIVLRLEQEAADIISDRGLLERVLENLVGNAIRYTDQGEVVIATKVQQDVMRIAISDTGAGIASDMLENIFDEYVQVDNHSNDLNQGLGLGLSIVKHITRILDHPLSVTSKLGEGSTFTVQVPVSHSKEVPTDKSLNNTVPATVEHSGSLNALLVDDDSAIIDATRMLLESENIAVQIAMSGEDAIALVEAGFVPQVILTDYRLPGCNGLELAQNIRKLVDHNVPCVIITGDPSTIANTANHLSNCTIMNKPVDSDKLMSVLTGIRTS